MNSTNMQHYAHEDLLMKPEFVISDHIRTLAVNCIADTDMKELQATAVKTNKKKYAHKKILKGQNKGRMRSFTQDNGERICPFFADVCENEALPICSVEKCACMHDIDEYLKKKPEDLGEECYIFSLRGHCPRGIGCRFGKMHISSNGRNIRSHVQYSGSDVSMNFLSKELQNKLRKKVYDFSRSEKILYDLDQKMDKGINTVMKETPVKSTFVGEMEGIECGSDLGDMAKPTARERKRIVWKDKLYLSPLTTLGNLPFRRICKEFGADITCGEMAMASQILQGVTQEYALIRRHHSEDIFGVQICGNNPYTMTKCVQLLEEQATIDFIDVNLGCPLDFVYNEGSGSGLLRRDKMLGNILKHMTACTMLPITVKSRTGVYKNSVILDRLVPRFVQNGVSAISVHGRTREQRYTKCPDWAYIEECAKLAGDVPVFGNGDILTLQDYEEAKQKCPHIAGVLLARGALIKPWLFTEIKQRRNWDISSSERFEIIKKFVNYGLDHWGSDTRGVENTRRFLLEWLSFLCRYVPLGLLEAPQRQRINQRPPPYKGRDDLETLFASGNCSDWIKISEMFLGPVPDGFRFLPKHKASSWK